MPIQFTERFCCTGVFKIVDTASVFKRRLFLPRIFRIQFRWSNGLAASNSKLKTSPAVRDPLLILFRHTLALSHDWNVLARMPLLRCDELQIARLALGVFQVMNGLPNAVRLPDF